MDEQTAVENTVSASPKTALVVVGAAAIVAVGAYAISRFHRKAATEVSETVDSAE